MKTKTEHIPNEIPDFVDERDVFGLINPKRIEDHKTLNSILNKAEPDIGVTYASLSARLNAYIIDLIIVFTFLKLLDNASNYFIMLYKGIGIPEIVIAAFIWILYCTIFESSKYQATIGKMIFKIKVIDTKGKRLHFIKSFFRTLFAMTSILPLGLGIWGIANNSRKQGWHDMLLDTYVIKSWSHDV